MRIFFIILYILEEIDWEGIRRIVKGKGFGLIILVGFFIDLNI